jgi:O-antigen/teichoic acid export membrane protein
LNLVEKPTPLRPERARPQVHTIGSRLLQNTMANVLGQVFFVALTFVSTPYITRTLGAAQYGTLSLLMSYLFAFSLLNLGVNTSLVKYLAELLPQGRTRDIQEYVSTSMTLLLGIGLLIGAIVSLLAGPIVRACFKGTGALMEPTILSLRIASFAFILQFFCQVASAVPAAAQRFEILNFVRSFSDFLRIAGTVLLISLGMGLPALMCAILFSILCACAGYTLAAKKLLPSLQMRPGFSQTAFRSLIHHSKYVLVSNASNQLVATADNFLIGCFLPVSNVAYYGIAYALAQRLWGVIGNAVSVVFPAASAFSGADREADVRELYLRGMKLAAAIGCFPALAVCIYSGKFLLFWLGPEYASHGATVLALLTAGFLVNSFTQVPYQVLQSTKHADTAAKGAMWYTALNLTLYVILIPPFGILGAAGAFFCAQVLFVPWFIGKANALLGIEWGTLVRASYARVFPPAIAGGLVCWVCRPWVHSFLTLAPAAGLGFLVYLLSSLVLVMDTRERAAIQLLLGRWRSLLQLRWSRVPVTADLP